MLYEHEKVGYHRKALVTKGLRMSQDISMRSRIHPMYVCVRHSAGSTFLMASIVYSKALNLDPSYAKARARMATAEFVSSGLEGSEFVCDQGSDGWCLRQKYRDLGSSDSSIAY